MTGHAQIIRLSALSPITAVIVAALMTIPSGVLAAETRHTASISTLSQAVYGDLRIGFMQSVDSMNPYVGINEASRMFYGLVYDCLQSVGEDLEAAPNLALSSYQVPITDPEMVGMPYGSIWQYNLTRNASWSDGVPFNADDVVLNINMATGPHTYYEMWALQPYAYFMNTAWKVDDYTVRVSFWDRATGKPMPCSYAYLLSIPILPKHLLDLVDTSYLGMSWPGVWSDSESPGMPIVGTGPFIGTADIYSEWITGDHLTLKRNPNYHQMATVGKAVMFDSLTMRFYQDSTSMVLALKNNEIDVASFPPTAYRSIKDDVSSGLLKNVTVFDGPKIDQYWTEVAFDMNNAGPNPSRLDPIIRQAMHMATNKSHVVDNYYLGLAEPATTLIPTVNTQWHYEPNATEKAKFAYDLSGAASLLEANGYIDVDSDGIRECTISSPAVQNGYVAEGKKLIYELLVRKEYPEEKAIAMYLQGQWAQIGVQINYLVVEELTLAGAAYSYAYDALLWYWSADLDPNRQLFVLSSYAIDGWSDCRYSNPAYDSAYGYSVNTTDPSMRKAWVDKAQSIFYNDSAYIILAYKDQTYAWRDDTFIGWGNWSAHPGRSLDNYWSANPLFFSLTLGESGPVPLYLTARPNPARTLQTIDFNVSGYSPKGLSLTFTLDFGDNEQSSADSHMDPAGVQNVSIKHKYLHAGNYTLTITVDDNSNSSLHSVTTQLVEWMVVEEGVDLQTLLIVGGVMLASAVAVIAVIVYFLLRKKGRMGAQTDADRQGPPNPPPPG